MNARLVVQDHPYVVVTDDNGHFEFHKLPTGKWTFRAWHEKAGYISKVGLAGKLTVWSKGRFESNVQSGDTDLGEIALQPEIFE